MKKVKFQIIDNGATDISCALRINQMQNGFSLKHQGSPIYFKSIQECAEAVSQALIEAFESYNRSNPH